MRQGSAAPDLKCPLCGGLCPGLPDYKYENGRIWFRGVLLQFTVTEARLFNFFYSNRNHILEKDALFNLLWGHDPNGGPISAESGLKKYLYEVRTAIENQNIPVRIQVYYKLGYSMELIG